MIDEDSPCSSNKTATTTTTSPNIDDPGSSSSSCSENSPSGTDQTLQDSQLFDDAYKPDLSNCRAEFQQMGSSQSDFSWGFDRFLCTQEVLELTNSGVLEEGSSNQEFSEFERMKVERQISASLYAINGVQEYIETVHDPNETLWDLPPLCSLFC